MSLSKKNWKICVYLANKSSLENLSGREKPCFSAQNIGISDSVFSCLLVSLYHRGGSEMAKMPEITPERHHRQ